MKKRYIIGGAIALVVIAAVAGGGGGAAEDAVDNEAAPKPTVTQEAVPDAIQNVTLDGCPAPEFDVLTIPLTVLNPTSKTSTYSVEISILDATGTQVGSANAFVENAVPQRPTKAEAFGNVAAGSTGPFKCELIDVTRTEAL